MPTIDILNRARRFNPHGFGFVSTKHRYKTMDFEVFLSRLNKVGKDEDCVIHFRYATHGSVCRRNCHPFVENGVYFAHNGIIDIRTKDDMTDSETAFKSRIYPNIEKYGFDSVVVDRIIQSMIGGSRFAFMYKGRVKLYGDYKLMNGVYYSNLRFL